MYTKLTLVLYEQNKLLIKTSRQVWNWLVLKRNPSKSHIYRKFCVQKWMLKLKYQRNRLKSRN